MQTYLVRESDRIKSDTVEAQDPQDAAEKYVENYLYMAYNPVVHVFRLISTLKEEEWVLCGKFEVFAEQRLCYVAQPLEEEEN